MRVQIALAVIVAGVPAVAAAQSTSVNGQIAYIGCGPSSIPFGADTQCDIWVMNADGTGQTNLTNTTDQNEISPAWSPDGQRIAYFSGFGLDTLMVMNADGSGKTALVPDVPTYPFLATPSWSPGGTQIAFVRMRPGEPVSAQGDVAIVDLTTGNERILTGPVDFGHVLLTADEFEPAWSPDGAKIAMTAVRLEQYPDPMTGAPTTGAQDEIVIMNTDGSGEVIVTAGEPGTDRANYLEDDRKASWSPDGRMLAFMSQAQVPSCCGPWQIWAVNADGAGATNLSADPTVNDLFPSWSPDGTQILFTRDSDLYSMPAPTSLPLPAAATVTALPATGSATRLTTNGNAQNAHWGRNPAAPAVDFPRTLRVQVSAQGKGVGGVVMSEPAGIKCGRACSRTFPSGVAVTLTADPRKGARFLAWGGACAGNQPTCTITLDDVKFVSAAFVSAR